MLRIHHVDALQIPDLAEIKRNLAAWQQLPAASSAFAPRQYSLQTHASHGHSEKEKFLIYKGIYISFGLGIFPASKEHKNYGIFPWNRPSRTPVAVRQI